MRKVSYIDTIAELDALVRPLITKYRDLAQDHSVTDALEQLRLDTKLYYKLGPSNELRAAEKLIKDVKLHTAVSKSKSTAKKKASNSKGSAKPK